MLQLNSIYADPLFSTSAPGRSLLSAPLGFIDVGARGGVHPVVEPLAGATAVLAFDLDKEECARLEKEAANHSPWAAFRVYPAALAGEEGTTTLYRFITPTNDSLREENPLVVQRYNITTLQRTGTMPLQTTTLDKILYGQGGLPDYYGEFIKLDTQGTEFEILQGAQRTLVERTVALIVEVCFFPLYTGQKLFPEVELCLRELGFSFYGFHSLHHRSRKSLNKHTEAGRERVLWADAIFFKDPIPVGFNQAPLSKRGNHVLFTCALLTGYYDFALEIALNTWAKGEEAERIEKLVHKCAQLPLSKTYDELMALVDILQKNPSQVNIEVGHFVDSRRHMNDYDDIPQQKQEPKNDKR